MSKSKRHKHPRASEAAAGATLRVIDEDKLFEAVGGDALLAAYLAACGQSIMEFAERHRLRVIRESTSTAMIGYQQRGRKMSHHCPYGWKINPRNRKFMVVNPAEQEMIVRVAALRKDGLSWKKIGARMALEGFEPRKGGLFKCATLQRIVKRAERQTGKKFATALDNSEKIG
jgi:hypothetical protein